VDCRGSSPLRWDSHSSSVNSRAPGAESSADHLLMTSASSSDVASPLSSRPADAARASEPRNRRVSVPPSGDVDPLPFATSSLPLDRCRGDERRSAEGRPASAIHDDPVQSEPDRLVSPRSDSGPEPACATLRLVGAGCRASSAASDRRAAAGTAPAELDPSEPAGSLVPSAAGDWACGSALGPGPSAWEGQRSGRPESRDRTRRWTVSTGGVHNSCSGSVDGAQGSADRGNSGSPATTASQLSTAGGGGGRRWSAGPANHAGVDSGGGTCSVLSASRAGVSRNQSCSVSQRESASASPRGRWGSSSDGCLRAHTLGASRHPRPAHRRYRPSSVDDERLMWAI